MMPLLCPQYPGKLLMTSDKLASHNEIGDDLNVKINNMKIRNLTSESRDLNVKINDTKIRNHSVGIMNMSHIMNLPL